MTRPRLGAREKRPIDPDEILKLLDTHHDICTWEELGFHTRHTGRNVRRRMQQLGLAQSVGKRLKRRKRRQMERTQLLYLFYLAFLAEYFERTPTVQDIDEFEADGGPSHAVYFTHFGGLREAQMIIGCQPNSHGDVRRLHSQETAAVAA